MYNYYNYYNYYNRYQCTVPGSNPIHYKFKLINIYIHIVN